MWIFCPSTRTHSLHSKQGIIERLVAKENKRKLKKINELQNKNKNADIGWQ